MEQVEQDRFLTDDELVRGDVKVSWVELGEGWFGDYNEAEEEDEELLRFDVYVRGALIEAHWAEGEMGDGPWRFVPKTSYCTRFPAETSPEQRRAGLLYIMNKVYAEAAAGSSISRLCQEASWIEPGWLEPPVEHKTEQILEQNTEQGETSEL
jgi:hypothetical protein